MYGHAWTSSYGDNPRGPAGVEWATTLAGMTRADIDAGLDACRAEGREFPPSAPRFRAMCLRIPSLSAVRYECTKRDAEKSQFAFLVWQKMDTYSFRYADTKTAEKMIRDAYDLACEAVMRGHPLPEPVVAIAHDTGSEMPKITLTPDERAARSHAAWREIWGAEPADFEAPTE